MHVTVGVFLPVETLIGNPEHLDMFLLVIFTYFLM